jgi:hypothetical protein
LWQRADRFTPVAVAALVDFPRDFHWSSTGEGAYDPSVVGAAQLDIFIPLQRSTYFPEWSRLARENHLDVAAADGVRAFADWLRENGRAPAGLSVEALTVLVAVMQDYERGGSLAACAV